MPLAHTQQSDLLIETSGLKSDPQYNAESICISKEFFN